MSELKTVRQWLEELPEPHKPKALDNLNECADFKECACIQGALMHAFIWRESPEGLDYWSDVYKSLNTK